VLTFSEWSLPCIIEADLTTLSQEMHTVQRLSIQ
jgi:hypothetical protein